MKVIKLRRLSYDQTRWSGDRVEDGDLLSRIPGAKSYFSDTEYDKVLGAVSEYGYCLETPLGESD